MIASLLGSGVAERVEPGGWRFSEHADYQALHRAQRGDYPATEFLLSKYRTLVCNKARSYFLVGAESDDLVQVGMIGLWQAIVDYRADRAVSFYAFAKVCIVNHMISAIQSASRFKQIPLNSSVSFETPLENAPVDVSLGEVLPSEQASPERTLLAREDTQALQDALRGLLSDFEWRVLAFYRLGKSYREIAAELGCKTKSIDNALTRIKHKVSSLPLGHADLFLVL